MSHAAAATPVTSELADWLAEIELDEVPERVRTRVQGFDFRSLVAALLEPARAESIEQAVLHL